MVGGRATLGSSHSPSDSTNPKQGINSIGLATKVWHLAGLGVQA